MRPQAGFAELHVGTVCGSSTILGSRARSPVCLLAPQCRGASVWAYTGTLGGGMVAGDEVSISIRLDRGARCFLGTQASNKVYRNPQSRACSQTLQATLASDALLVLAPDPVQCFAEARYEQRQRFDLSTSANLILVDWFSAGRLARGERWAFHRYLTRNEVRRDGRIFFLDALELDHESATNKFRSGRFNALATVFMSGPLLEGFVADNLRRIEDQPVSKQASLILAASPTAGGAVFRFAGAGVAEVGTAIHSHLSFVRGLLEDDPWARKW